MRIPEVPIDETLKSNDSRVTISINKQPSEQTFQSKTFVDNSMVGSPEMSIMISKQPNRNIYTKQQDFTSGIESHISTQSKLIDETNIFLEKRIFEMKRAQASYEPAYHSISDKL